jgi:hypothetical protein
MAYTARDLEALRAAQSAKMERDMATSPTLAVPQKQLEDPLAHLPCSSILEYRKGQVIYNQDQPSTSIYLVIDGKVKVCRMADDGRQVVVDIYQTDEFFGESAFLSSPTRDEQALALENTKVSGPDYGGDRRYRDPPPASSHRAATDPGAAFDGVWQPHRGVSRWTTSPGVWHALIRFSERLGQRTTMAPCR